MKRLSHTATTPLCVVIAGLALGIIYLRHLMLPFAWEAEQLLIRETGILAFTLFSASFLCTPIRQVAKRLGHKPPLHAWRRSLGLTSTLAALCHLLVSYRLHLVDTPIFGAWFQPYAQAGVAALLLLLALSITSFPKLTRHLKVRHWKTLHRLIFVIFFLLLLHIILGPHLPSNTMLTLLFILAVVSWTGRLNP